MIDWNFFPLEPSESRPSEARQTLIEMHRAGLIMLARSDVADTEALNADPDVRSTLQAQSSELSEYFGPLILDHSRLGSSVLGTEEDQVLLETVFAALFSGREWLSGNPHDQRDAMHVAWAIRYAFDGFITDEKKLLKRRQAIGVKYDFSILSPDDALVIARRLQARAETRQRVQG